MRLDSGFFQSDILDYLEESKKNYIIAARFTKPIQRVICARQNWIEVDKGIEIKEEMYQSDSWPIQRRLIIVRQRISDRPKAGGKNLSLFPEEEEFRNYRYSAYVTNLTYAASDVWRLYRMRAKAENQIKELKYDFGFDSFNLQGFMATEAALSFAMIAYNLMSLFRLIVLQDKVQRRLSTIRYRTFAVGAYFEKVNDTMVLKIALHKKRRRWFEQLWNTSHNFELPLSIA